MECFVSLSVCRIQDKRYLSSGFSFYNIVAQAKNFSHIIIFNTPSPSLTGLQLTQGLLSLSCCHQLTIPSDGDLCVSDLSLP